MNKFMDPFTYNLPRIDLHGLDRVAARVKCEEFINDNKKLRNKKIVIIHGMGEGILKKEVHDYLKHNKNVINYSLNYNNIGETIVEIKIDI